MLFNTSRGIPNLNVVAKTANYTLTLADDVVTGSVSGGAFTLTLPSAVGLTGRQFLIKRTDQTLGTLLNIATTSSQTINGSTTTTLATQYEELLVISDGSNWIAKRYILSDWTSYTPTFTGFGTVSVQSFWWRRVGTNIEVRGIFTAGTTTATEARVSLPATSSTSLLPTISIAGKAAIDSSAPTVTRDYVTLMEPTVAYVTFGYQEGSGSAALTKLNGNSLVSSGQKLSFFCSVPIVNWNS